MNSPYWFGVAVIFGVTAVGNILMGHWEAGTPRWRRVLKPFLISGVAVLISAKAGREWFYVMIVVMTILVLVIHCWWLPVMKGIHGWTAEPREKYYAWRGWPWPPKG